MKKLRGSVVPSTEFFVDNKKISSLSKKNR